MGVMRMKLRLAAAVVLCAGALGSQAQSKDKPAPDVLVFTNGDQLTGKFERAVGGNVVFKSDMAGELTVSFDKVKELRSSESFVAIRKGQEKHPVTASGAVEVAGGNVVVKPENGPEQTIAPKDLGYLIDTTTYDHEITHQPGFFHAWNGSLTGGATLVRATDNTTSYTAGVALVRAIPTVPYLTARNRTTFNVTETYGKQTSPTIPPTNPPTPVTVVLTNIFHADAERDEYFKPKLYALADTSFDHNYAQGLQLQQVFGAGVGWTARKTGKDELDVKADVHYEEQRYIQTTPGVAPQSSVNLIGSTLTEMYTRHLPRKMAFTETADYLPAWNIMHDYSANVSGSLALPVFKRLSASITTTDNYLNDPAEYYKKNSFQFVTGVTYTLH
jgi:hypothetical protein